jgi:hypothetical protein
MSKHNDKTDGSLKGRPECIDPACAGKKGEASPFKTYDMNQNSDNCSYINCQQWINFGPTIGVDNVNTVDEMEMNCGATKHGAATKKSQIVNGKKSQIVNGKKSQIVQSNKASIVEKEMSNQNKGIIGILLFVALIFFIFVGLSWLQSPPNEFELLEAELGAEIEAEIDELTGSK